MRLRTYGKTKVLVETHTPGSFCTAVLRTRNVERAAKFYSALVGWTTETVPGADGHMLIQFDGKTVASIHPIPDDRPGSNDIWVPCVSVEDIQRTTMDALKLGATLLERVHVPGVAWMATLRDRENTVFGLWQPAPHQGAQLMEVLGSLWWIEILSNDVAGARDFYARLFGWTTVEISFEPFPAYTIFKRGETQEGGILPIGPSWGVSPRWNSIFAVDDCNATLERAESLGGSTVFVHTVPKAGRIGLISDPGGALFVMRGPVQ